MKRYEVLGFKFQVGGGGLGLEGFLDGIQQLIGFERFEEYGGEPFLVGAYDGMIRIVTETGHEDDGDVFGVGGGEDLVAVGVGEFNVGDDQIVLAAVDESDRFAAVGRGVRETAAVLDDIGNGLTDELFVVHDEDSFSGHFFGHGAGGSTLGADNAFGAGL